MNETCVVFFEIYYKNNQTNKIRTSILSGVTSQTSWLITNLQNHLERVEAELIKQSNWHFFNYCLLLGVINNNW